VSPLADMIRDKERSLAADAGIAVALAALAFVARLALDPWLGARQPYTPAFAFIAIAAWLRGWRPAALCTVACQVLSNYFFIEPRNQFTLDFTEGVAASSYYFTAFIIIYLGHRASAARVQLEREAAQKDVFIATLSHELRNPLAPIATATELLARENPSQPGARAAVGILQRQVGHMARLLDDLLDMSRITQGRLDIRREPVDVMRCVEDAAESAREGCAARAQQLEVSPAGGPLMALGDATRITQIVANLLNNASKYSQEGARIVVSVRRAGDEIAIIVGDNGPGIERELLPDLFEAFRKNDPRGPKSGNGLGIGLWLANRLARLHGGRIDVESRRGMGTVFTVRLLAAPVPPA
jgi:signal transduction histidine kinase